MNVLRYCLIGSIIFHIGLMSIIGFYLPGLTSQTTERVFEVVTEPAFSTNTISSHPGAKRVDRQAIPKKAADNRAPFLPVKPGRILAQASIGDNSGNKPSTAPKETSHRLSSVEEPANIKKVSNTAGSLTEISSRDSKKPNETVNEPGISGPDLGKPVGSTNGTGISGSGSGKSGISNVPGNGSVGNGSRSPGGVATELTTPDIPPVKIYAPTPEYPWKAKQNNWEGIILLRAEVLQNGKIGKISISKPSGYEVLDKAAQKTVKTWRYKPALKNGKSVTCFVEIKIHFQLEG